MSRVEEVMDICVDNEDVHFVFCPGFLSSKCKRQHIPGQGTANVPNTAAVCINFKLTWPEWS